MMGREMGAQQVETGSIKPTVDCKVERLTCMPEVCFEQSYVHLKQKTVARHYVGV